MINHPTVIFLLYFLVINSFYVIGQEATPLAAFDRLEVYGAVEVILIPGQTESIRKQGDANELKWMHQGNTLTINTPCRSDGQPAVTLFLTYRQLQQIKAGNCAWVRTQSTLNAQTLDLDISYYAHAYLDISVDEVDVRMKEGAFLELSGRTQHYRADINNASLQRWIEIEGSSKTKNRSTECEKKKEVKQKKSSGNFSAAL